MEVPVSERVLFKLLPPGTSIQALMMFVPGARMSTTVVISYLALPVVFRGEGDLRLP